MDSKYLLIIVALVPAWQPQSSIKHLPELEAGLLIGKKLIQSRLHFLPRQIYRLNHALIHCIPLPESPTPVFSFHFTMCLSPSGEKTLSSGNALKSFSTIVGFSSSV